MSQQSPPLGERIDGASNVLLLAPALSTAGDRACAELVDLAPLPDEIALSVSFGRGPDERLDVWTAELSRLPGEIGIVDVGEATRSETADATVSGRSSRITIDAVSEPSNLTEIGVALTKYITAWRDEEARVAGCFNSLTTLLQYVDLQQAFRFLHAVTSRLEEIGAVTHYHLDPSAHDDRTVNTLKQLFDAVVEVDDQGEVSVTVRPSSGSGGETL